MICHLKGGSMDGKTVEDGPTHILKFPVLEPLTGSSLTGYGDCTEESHITYEIYDIVSYTTSWFHDPSKREITDGYFELREEDGRKTGS